MPHPDFQFEPLTRPLHRLVAARARESAIRTCGIDENTAAKQCNGYAFALLRNGVAVAAGGLVPIWHGHAEAWLITTEDCGPRDLARVIQRCGDELDALQRDRSFRRVQMTILWTAPWRVSFAMTLGFDLEGRMRAWGPEGADYALYARTSPEDC